jgi:hypothetical protein
MGTCRTGSVSPLTLAEVSVSEAAIRTWRRLFGLNAGRIRAHAYRDGGLICEDRMSPARPRLWRIAADGALLADSSYNFTQRAFIRVPVPGEVAA